MNRPITLAAAVALGLLAAAGADARTKLTTLPDRARVVMSLENPQQTLLMEEREIPLGKGTNFVDFAWAGVSIDPASVMIQMLDHPGAGPEATKIIATSFPPNENALTWQVYAPEPRTERIRVSYLLYGISQEASYEMAANKEETRADLRQYLLLRNASGEDLDDTIVRIPQLDDLTRSVDSGEARRFLAFRNRETPFRKLYIASPTAGIFRGDDPEPVSLVYEVDNEKANGLGIAKLPYGKARLYGDDGMDSQIFLGEDFLDETPPGEEVELALGAAKDVVLKRYEVESKQVNVRFNSSRRAVLFDVERIMRYEIENFKDQPVTLKVVEPMTGEWQVKEVSDTGVRQERKSAGELIFYIDLPARPAGAEAEKKEITIQILQKNRFPNE